MSRRRTKQNRTRMAAWFVVRRIPGGVRKVATAHFCGEKMEWRGIALLPFFQGAPVLSFAQREWWINPENSGIALERAMQRYRQRCQNKINPSEAMLWNERI